MVNVLSSVNHVLRGCINIQEKYLHIFQDFIFGTPHINICKLIISKNNPDIFN